MGFRIPWTPVCFRVELHGSELEVFILKPFHGFIVHVGICNDAPLGECVFIHRKPVVLGGDIDPPADVPDRLVCTPVSEFELVCIAAHCKRRDLVAHADAEDGELSKQIPDTPYRLFCLLRVARPVTHKERIRFAGKDPVGGHIVGKDKEVAFSFCKARDHILLDAEVDHRNPFPAPFHMVRGFARDIRDGNNIRNLRRFFGEPDRRFAIIASGDKGSTHCPVHPGLDGQRTGINTLHAKKTLFLKIGSDGRFAGRLLADLFCNATKCADTGVLEVRFINTIVADLGEREHQDLPEVTGIGEGFHVPGHLRIEDEFPGTFPLNPKSFTDNKFTILKTQNRLHDFHILCACQVINDNAGDNRARVWFVPAQGIYIKGLTFDIPLTHRLWKVNFMGTFGRKIVDTDVEDLAKLLNKAYSDEWLAYYQYWIGSKIVRGPNKEAVIAELTLHATEELGHATLLTTRIIQLGGTPVTKPQDWFKLTNCGYDAPDDPSVFKVLEQNIKGEQCAIKTYNSLLKKVKDKDPITYNIVIGILQMEVEHEEDLQALLEDINVMLKKR